MENFNRIQELLRQKAEYQARIKLIPYDGSPEVKEQSSGKYIYIRKRIGGKLTSKYVDVYSEELYQLLVKNAKELRELRKEVKAIDKQLLSLGYVDYSLPESILRNIDFARANLKGNIYDQAVLEGVATTFPQTEAIIDNGEVSGMTPYDIQKILNLKHAWEFILDKDVIKNGTDYGVLTYIARIVNEGFITEGGRVRNVPVTIGGTSYVPPIPEEYLVKEELARLLKGKEEAIDKAISLCLYCMKTQIFVDGNKRTAVILACHYLITQGAGLLVIPEKRVPEFKQLLVNYYEGKGEDAIRNFLKEKCWSPRN